MVQWRYEFNLVRYPPRHFFYAHRIVSFFADNVIRETPLCIHGIG